MPLGQGRRKGRVEGLSRAGPPAPAVFRAEEVLSSTALVHRAAAFPAREVRPFMRAAPGRAFMAAQPMAAGSPEAEGAEGVRDKSAAGRQGLRRNPFPVILVGTEKGPGLKACSGRAANGERG